MAKALEVRQGVEVSVETGLGNVTKVDPPKGRNAHVTIEAPHLKNPVMSWVDTSDLKLYNRVLEACEQGYRIGYSIVVHRKRDQPTDVPLDQIPNTQRVRDLEEVTRVAGQTPTSTADQPAATPAPVSAPGPEAPPPVAQPVPAAGVPSCGQCGRALTDGLPVRRLHGVLQHVECPGVVAGPLQVTDEPQVATATVTDAGDVATPDASPAPGGDASPPDPASTEPPAEARRPQPRVQEGRPWEYANSDGSLNLGSYAVQAAEGVVLLAQEQLLERARRVEGPFVVPSIGQINALARRLLRAADLVQASIREDGHVVRMASSHSRARSAIRASLAIHPVPVGASAADVDAWVEALAHHASCLLHLTIDLIDPEPL